MYTTCRVGVLSSKISKHSKISPPPSLRSHLTSSPMGVLSGDYGNSSSNNFYQCLGCLLRKLEMAPSTMQREVVNRNQLTSL